MTIPFIYYAQRHKFAWTFVFSQWMKIHKFFLPTTRIFELERILTSFEKVEESRRSERKKNWTKWKNRRKIVSMVIKVLSFDRAVSRDSKKLHDNKQHRLSFEQASSSILFFDFSATLPALVFFLPSSGSHHSAWPSGIYPEPPTRRISSSDMFWFHFLFFFCFLWFHSRFILESHAFGIQGGMPAMRATGTCRETHTWGEDGSTNTVSCKNKKGEKGAKRPFPLWPKRYMARVSWLSMLYGAKPKRWKINASFLSKIVESEQFRELICNLTISKIFLAQRCAVSIYVITLDTESEIIWIIFR